MKNADNMTNRQLAAQSVIAELSLIEFLENPGYKSNIISLVQEGIGGFYIYNGSVEQSRKITEELQILTDVYLLFCNECENGISSSFNGVGTDFPHNFAIGRNEPEISKLIGEAIANEATYCGINWLLAPVCEVSSPRFNPLLNLGTFGSNPYDVALHAQNYISGAQSKKVICSAKYFPGIYNSYISDDGFPVLISTLEQLQKHELPPFFNSIKAGVKSITVSHAIVPSLDKSGLPACLSENIIEKFLKGRLGYDGIVISDRLDNDFIIEKYSTEAALLTLKAGADLAFVPRDLTGSIDWIENEINNNNEFKEKIKENIKKIISQKNQISPHFITEDIHKNFQLANEKIALQAAYKALSKEDIKDLIPIINENISISGFAILKNVELEPPTLFFRILSQTLENNLNFGFLDFDISDPELQSLKDGCADDDLAIFAFFIDPSLNFELEEIIKINKIISALSEKKKSIAICFGTMENYQEIKTDSKLFLFSNSLPSIAASILCLSGRNPQF